MLHKPSERADLRASHAPEYDVSRCLLKCDDNCFGISGSQRGERLHKSCYSGVCNGVVA